MSECKIDKEYLGQAARMWCEKTTEQFVMIPELAMVIAERLEADARKIAELEQQLAAERDANRWIPVSERLPDINETALFKHTTKEYGEKVCLGMGSFAMVNCVTHWKPIN